MQRELHSERRQREFVVSRHDAKPVTGARAEAAGRLVEVVDLTSFNLK